MMGIFFRKAYKKAMLSSSCHGYIHVAPLGGKAGLILLCLIALWMFGCATPEKSDTADTRPTASPAPAPLSQPVPAQMPPSSSRAPASSSLAKTNGWISLFNGQNFEGWKVTDFAGRGEVRVKDGQILLEMGVMTGITWTGAIPRLDYEVELEAMRVDGSDFFCGLTFPVGDDPCSLIVGGWGGGVVGLSSIDGEDAANNQTTHYMNFEKGRWYRIRLRVTRTAIQAWIDAEQVVDIVTTGHRISIRSEVELSKPFGISSWSTTAALRNIRVRRL